MVIIDIVVAIIIATTVVVGKRTTKGRSRP